MSDRTSIEWTDATLNPIRARNVKTGKIGWHCQKISPGCQNCYAESMNRRLGTRLSYVPAGGAGLFLDEKKLTEPLRWRKPRRVFVCSMTDLFADFVTDGWIERVFAVMLLAPRHTFQVLTKRAQRMRDWVSTPGRLSEVMLSAQSIAFDEWTVAGRTGLLPRSAHCDNPHFDITVDCPGWPLPNVWLGVSTEDQQRLDERAPHLIKTPAAVRFLSIEPMLGPIDASIFYYSGYTQPPYDDVVNWVIVGGESGPRRRPMDLGWARSIRDQCRGASVPFFMKQVDKVIPVPSDLSIREMPGIPENAA